MGKRAFAAIAAAFSVAPAVSAHEFVCEKNIDDAAVRELDDFPARVHVSTTVTNTHPTDVSRADSVKDDWMERLGLSFSPAAPFSLDVGKSVTFDFKAAIESSAQCAKAARAQACAGRFDDTFEVDFDGGVAQCRARVICAPAVGEASGVCEPRKGIAHGLSFWKTHEKIVSACLAQGPIDLGIATVSTVADAEGVLWGSAKGRKKLDRMRLVLARELLVATCNVRVLGAQWASADEPMQALAVLSGTACREVEKFNLALKLDQDCEEGRKVDAGAADAQHAQSMAADPIALSGDACSDENGGGR